MKEFLNYENITSVSNFIVNSLSIPYWKSTA